MNAQDLTLNIAVNMGRLCRWAAEGKEERVKQFLIDTQVYVDQLENTPQSEKFRPTFEKFRKKFDTLKTEIQLNDEWAEEALTWANILTHRAKLA